jgi:hypothetical protein
MKFTVREIERYLRPQAPSTNFLFSLRCRMYYLVCSIIEICYAYLTDISLVVLDPRCGLLF